MDALPNKPFTLRIRSDKTLCAHDMDIKSLDENGQELELYYNSLTFSASGRSGVVSLTAEICADAADIDIVQTIGTITSFSTEELVAELERRGE